ncbi:phospholipid carrier-dependent glycosyltransferase [Spirosoma taeanense]|uniref:Phospholipid carrier-dependent glycosyltransferase n=1 Tax=Spirosoma taeanense TaxID=2735870 RepID=A0A6M5Y8M2_9BACT|nr:glycosyltransferase family 39 protein [Spirosoma taeanense]QJW90638.1 phospholipid carrier-dependent glycosyltransferase [Spirosoma taeanense]
MTIDQRSDFLSFLTRSRYIIFLILLLALGLRLYKSSVHGLYLDEKFTLVNTQGVSLEGANQHDVFFTPGKTYFTPREFWKPKPLKDYIRAIVQTDIGNSPAHYALLWAWIEVFGLSDLSIRMPSILFSTFIVGLVYLLVRRYLRSQPLALLCALLTAFEPFFIAYSHMARNYCMTIFMATLGTYLFLRILDRRAEDKQPVGLYIGYGLSFALATLGHYLAVTVFLCHGIYVLLYIRNFKTYVGLGLSFLGGMLGLIVPWFVFGGGKYTFQTLAYQAKLYGGLAQTNPLNNGFGIILPATLANVVKRSIPVWADLFLVSNGLSADTLAFRNLVIALGMGLIAVFLVHRFGRQRSVPTWVQVAVPVLLVAGFALYSVPSVRLVIAAALPLFFYLLYRAFGVYDSRPERRFLYLLLLLATVPTLFLIAIAFRNGHTYGITQRYSSFSFPYALILVGMIVQQVFRQPTYLRLTLGAVLLIQAYFIGDLLYRIYEDQAPKYTYYGRYRIENPYNTAAQRIKKLYAPGDTVLYPSARTAPRDEIENTFTKYSIIDAQYTNLYLPKDATYYQRMDTTQTDRIILIKGKTGERITIFDFEGTKYRY